MSRIALLQAQTGVDPARNGAALVEAMRGASAGGAAMLFTPEMSGLLDRDRARAAANLTAEGDDPVLAAVRDAAARDGLWVHLGSLAIRRDDGLLANRSFVIDPGGEVRATYDKLHLFDVDLPTGESWRESVSYAPGSTAVVVEGTPVGRLGLTICYDIRFPALFSALAEAGAETIAVPAAFTVPTGKAHWEVLLRARAIEAGLFVVAAAQAGSHEDGRETYGHSLVADPWGELLLAMDGAPGLAFAEIDVGRIADVRERVPALSHRRSIPPVEQR
ncbi:carbon-nitrogen hydrolase family protein [Sphingomonas glaciei]|uniref:Carbon-nitrogen hydrolase family protein n=1 Tax=Sphingomonas glaciei TaxID=2938948 RepID=A0ABY5MXD0_9SPHN|nr:carbon-nitrogen hydrolase family protein [Sphingomonas glaciei]UUR08782.1 carbon-nitrogen hydrolase family protein [Sphingomonas glaciei]